jgi:hypothetical protein
MIDKEIEQMSASPRVLRKFGLLVGGVFLLLGGWFLFRHKPAWPYFIAPGALLFVAGLVMPRCLKRIYVLWMAFGFMLGAVVSKIILTVFYFLVMTPIGLIARLCGQDFLSLKQNPAVTSHWVMRPAEARQPSEYERQF